MILVDYSGVAIAGIMAQIRGFDGLNEDLVRHFILNSLRSYRSRFHRNYGELVICCDGRRSWRRDYYPYYKAKRRESKTTSAFDWAALFNAMDVVKQELLEKFPYAIVQVDRAEADDVMAVLAKKLPGPHLVVSNDRDLVQLQNVADIFAPLKNKKVAEVQDLREHVLLHILKGDSTDGIPNVLSDDDTFVNPDKRQKPMRQNRIAELTNSMEDEEILRNYKRNETLIDLDCIPEDIADKIVVSYKDAEASSKAKSRADLVNFFMEKKLRNLFDAIGDF
jgi:5'-3' exonuclease